MAGTRLTYRIKWCAPWFVASLVVLALPLVSGQTQGAATNVFYDTYYVVPHWRAVLSIPAMLALSGVTYALLAPALTAGHRRTLGMLHQLFWIGGGLLLVAIPLGALTGWKSLPKFETLNAIAAAGYVSFLIGGAVCALLIASLAGARLAHRKRAIKGN